MKKVGIITFHAAKNYGACLQAYALQTAIKAMGIEPVIVDYQPDSVYLQYKNFSLKKYLSSASAGQAVCYFASDIRYASQNNQGNAAFAKFRKYYSLTEQTYYTEQQLRNCLPRLDAVVVGSDQVWNTEITGGLDSVYMLKMFETPIKKVSYAASLGNEHVPQKYRNDYRRVLSEYKAISVREESGRTALEECGIDNVRVVLDPTLLLQKDEWLKVQDERMIPEEPYILVYMVYGENHELIELVNNLSNKLGLKIVTFQGRKTFENECRHCPTAGPADFIALFNGASFVVTNSFHGTAFSIIFEKEFYVCLNSKRNDRMLSLLNKVGLNRRVWQGKKQELDETAIDYQDVGAKLLQEREKSLKYLYDSIFVNDNAVGEI